MNLAGIPLLVAKCHERQATRSFRVDRIQTVTDFDGVVREPLHLFFRETLGFDWPRIGAAIDDADEIEERWKLARTVCRDSGAPLLCALALSDGEMLPEETAEIIDYVAAQCSDNGLDLTENECARLAAHIRKLRPTPEAIDKCLDQIADAGPALLQALLGAGVRVIEADGLVHSDEISVLNAFTLELTGTSAY